MGCTLQSGLRLRLRHAAVEVRRVGRLDSRGFGRQPSFAKSQTLGVQLGTCPAEVRFVRGRQLSRKCSG
eukprot:3430948-Alexandrium_andersonii.AAC.1